jgi:hypothetical protein
VPCPLGIQLLHGIIAPSVYTASSRWDRSWTANHRLPRANLIEAQSAVILRRFNGVQPGFHHIGKALQTFDSSGEVAWSFDFWNVQMPPTVSRNTREPRQCDLLPSRYTGNVVATIWRAITRTAQGTRPIVEDVAQRHKAPWTSGKNLAHPPFVLFLSKDNIPCRLEVVCLSTAHRKLRVSDQTYHWPTTASAQAGFIH